jgi:uncharacterized DUF497 family protein
VFKWNSDKNEKFFSERGISFDEVALAVSDGGLLDDYPHPNKAKYPNQRVMEVLIREYIYLVPYVQDGDEYFLKTVIPSRKAMKQNTGE